MGVFSRPSALHGALNPARGAVTALPIGVLRLNPQTARMGLVHVSFHPILCGSCRSRQSWGSRARAFPRPAPILAQADLGDCTLTHSSGPGAVPPPKDPASRPAASCQETGLGHWLGCDPRPDLSFPADMGRGGAGAGSCSDHAGRSPGADATAPPPDLTGCRHRLRGQRRAQEARTRGPCRPPRLPPPASPP